MDQIPLARATGHYFGPPCPAPYYIDRIPLAMATVHYFGPTCRPLVLPSDSQIS